MACARYYARMKRAFKGQGAFDTSKVPKFNPKPSDLPKYPDEDDDGNAIL